MAKFGQNILGLMEAPKALLKAKLLYKNDEALLKNLDDIPDFSNSDMSFSVVIPMYNERASALRCVSTLDAYLRKLPFKTRIIVVDDASSDGTYHLLQGMLEKFPRLLLKRHTVNAGYGGANITGIHAALEQKIDYVLFMDADLTQNVNYITSFIPHMLKGVDYIKATRYSDGGGVSGVPLRRWVVSYVGNWIARKMMRLQLTDYTNGFRAAKAELFRNLTFEERGFPYLIEEVTKVNKIARTFANVPYILTVREGGESKFIYSYKVYFKYLRWLFKD
jgi:glycosyltransferase involved in cell wall biosynthesis